MRHRKSTAKLGRTGEHRNAMLANLVRSLIKHKRITTTLAKAKATRPVAEKMLTLGKRAQAAVVAAGSAADDKAKAKAFAENVHCRRLLAARLHAHARTHFTGTPSTKGKALREKWRSTEDVVHILCDQIAPVYKDRAGGYTRIVRLAAPRRGDAGETAILEWVDFPADAGEAAPAKADGKKS
ncbi:MAG: 50S ribosomal protein L17 [Limisphaerales bacterium]